MALPRLYIIADYDYLGGGQPWRDYLAALHDAQDVIIQIRAHRLFEKDPAAFAAMAATARSLFRQELGTQTILLLNGPPTLSSQLGYTGTHLPEYRIGESKPAGGNNFTTCAVHSYDALHLAEQNAVDAVLFAPVFAPNSKTGEGVGVSELQAICADSRLPVYALGGITADNAALCQANGAYGVAVLGSVASAPEPLAMITQLQAVLDGWTGG